MLRDPRVYALNNQEKAGASVLYVMSRDQRVQDNHALVIAQDYAIKKKLPMAVVFCLQPDTGERSQEQYQFMIDGLHEVEAALHKLAIKFMLVIGKPLDTLTAVMYHTKPAAVFFDFNPLRGPRLLREKLAKASDMAMYCVDTHNCVPVWELSDIQEVGARTLRRKMHHKLSDYLVEPKQAKIHPFRWPGPIQTLEQLSERIQQVIAAQPENGTHANTKPGSLAAEIMLEHFIAKQLTTYQHDRNDPTRQGLSNLSPYLHFGQISPLRVVLRLREVAHLQGGDLRILEESTIPVELPGKDPVLQSVDAFIEELVVRRELADNFCWYNPAYDSLLAAPAWAQTSLANHRLDDRQYLYDYQTLENAKTHDQAWNAAQRQLTKTGKMHGYMRMYWAKKALEWTIDADQAVLYLIRLNDFYSLDGGDPNGYAGILWSVGGVHDRPWPERPIYGVVRSMVYDGLKRKFDIEAYQTKWR